jgi:hypothetical protein
MSKSFFKIFMGPGLGELWIQTWLRDVSRRAEKAALIIQVSMFEVGVRQ